MANKTDAQLDGPRLKAVADQIRLIYTSDGRPWVIGYSGGKDSTAAVQLVWHALAELPQEQRTKPVYIIASDTLVETPVIVDYINRSLERINAAAKQSGLPISAHKVLPELQNTFWVNMIGRGYPAPYRRFRWCTDRLKIEPANKFIQARVSEHGEVVLVLGVRRSESTTRARVIDLHQKPGQLLSPHSTLTGAMVYTPVVDFSTDDVWAYLLSVPSPWGNNNRDLVTMYRNAQAGECPLVVDKTTPSCGNSRFGCWTCTVVERDRSMEAMVDSGEEWLIPLLELRDWLGSTRDPAKKHRFREVRRRDGRVHIWGDNKDKIIWGPYKLEVRKEILRLLLMAEQSVQEEGPISTMRLISDEELHVIRRLWRMEEGDWEDSLPKIVQDATGKALDWVDDDVAGSSGLDIQVLADVCGKHNVPPGAIRELIDLERELQGLGRRTSVFDRIDRVLGKDWRTAEEVFQSINWRQSEQATELGGHDAD